MLKRILGYPLMMLSLVACVTINIYFPAAAAEEAARTIVRDVLGEGSQTDQEKTAPESTPASDDKATSIERKNSVIYYAMERILDFVVPPVQAAQPNMDINSPAISKLRSSMSTRQAGLAGYYRSGALGFTNNGSVAVRDMKLISLRDRNKVKKLVADENGDRKSLYAEIARANGQPQWEKDIRKTFARVWVEEAPKGYWYQNAAGKWQKNRMRGVMLQSLQ